MSKVISDIAIKRREYWIEEIRNLGENFGDDVNRLEKELEAEINTNGISTLIDHLRLCGNIPESYGHDSSEEKLYSKYTDVLLSLAYKALGMSSIVIKARGDVADVEAVAQNYSFVADAKANRLSLSASNPKDFKVQAMHGWKYGKPYAMVVASIQRLPHKTSQIYSQASTSNVCIFTYSHLALLLNYSKIEGKTKAQNLLHEIFKIIPALNPSKNATDYWLAINKTMLSFSNKIEPLWAIEKNVATESIEIAKEEALTFLAKEREKIMRMSRQEAIEALIKVNKIETKIKTIKAVSDNELFTIK